MKTKKSYIVHWESAYYIGFNSCSYGELTALKRQFKEEGKKITEIEYFENDILTERKIFN